jgi:hypothetical protein
MTSLAELAHRLRTDLPRISAQVMDEIWREEPFWERRFGERGRRRMTEDAAFHAEYLVQAIEAADGGVMKRYATWLQSVLTTRGMSTRHLDENFRRLAKAITKELSGAETAIEYLEGARAALRHADGPARELQDACERLSPTEDIRYVIAHVADAIALGRPELFAAHARWLGENGAAHQVREALDAIEKDSNLRPETKQAARVAAR